METKTNLLKTYGWDNDFWGEAAKGKGHPARIVLRSKSLYKAVSESGQLLCRLSGSLERGLPAEAYPTVGDWVMLDRPDDKAGEGIIRAVLPRKTCLTRTEAGTSGKGQAMAANVDRLFICMALDGNYNLRRLERWMTLAWESGAEPVVLLTKSDLAEDLDRRVMEAEQSAVGARVLALSLFAEEGLEAVKAQLEEGRTIALVGSSGVGKSSLINRLAEGCVQATKEVRSDGKGRHTTTSRELFHLPGKGLVIDSPGVREIQLFEADAERAFADIEALAEGCRFRDCAHESEPGCAVRRAVEEGRLSRKRLENYRKLAKEAAYAETRRLKSSRQAEKEKIIRMMGSLDATKKIKNRKR